MKCIGKYHIGIYTLLLLMFLVDPIARPQEYWMKKWIDMTRTMKSYAPNGAFDFFTYSELIYSFVLEVGLFSLLGNWECITIESGMKRGSIEKWFRNEEAVP